MAQMPIPIAKPALTSAARPTCLRLAICNAKVDTTIAMTIDSSVVHTS